MAGNFAHSSGIAVPYRRLSHWSEAIFRP
jgi:hypothetical protein